MYQGLRNAVVKPLELDGALLLGRTQEEPVLDICGRRLELAELIEKWEK